MKRYFFNILVWLTQGLNALLGGSPDESTSSRLYRIRARISDHPYKAVNWLFNDDNHCQKAYEAESAKVSSWERHS